MPVEFLSDEQAARYGRYHADPSPEQLARFFYLSPQDIQFLASYRRAYTQLGCAVQLSTLRFLGTFLPIPTRRCCPGSSTRTTGRTSTTS